ncbi:hypothetical protein [Paenibacillus polymyxa]|uniref:hypothetical protein n=1 Tax=Paenibacillus polymyxa TaxID=1406 RepID=UPI00234A6383|nr:hypothetical protein [Paenibacillus polymyxa]WCM60713.1 hypothetical protein OYT09_22585 [Paenibacillus polymyxa]
MDLNRIYRLHIQLLDVYERNQVSRNPYQKDINFYYRQLNFFCSNTRQRVFVLNQLLKLYEKSREDQIQWCSSYLRTSLINHIIESKEEAT